MFKFSLPVGEQSDELALRELWRRPDGNHGPQGFADEANDPNAEDSWAAPVRTLTTISKV